MPLRYTADGSGDVEHLLATDHVSHPFGAVDGLVLGQEILGVRVRLLM